MRDRDTDSPQGRTVVVLLCGGLVVSSWPLPEATRVDIGLIDELARLQLTARRVGCDIRLRHVDRQLSDLLMLSGLGDILTGDIVAANPCDRSARSGPCGGGDSG